MERLDTINIDDIEITLDFLESESVRLVFLGELAERRDDLLASLIETGKDEFRFKVQMIDEIFGMTDELREELKSRKTDS